MLYCGKLGIHVLLIILHVQIVHVSFVTFFKFVNSISENKEGNIQWSVTVICDDENLEQLEDYTCSMQSQGNAPTEADYEHEAWGETKAREIKQGRRPEMGWGKF